MIRCPGSPLSQCWHRVGQTEPTYNSIQRLRASSRGRAATLSNLDVAYGGSGGGTGSGTGLRHGRGLSYCQCGAEAADAGGWIEAAFVERDVRVETEIAAKSLVGHGDTKVGGVSGPPRWVVERLRPWCQLVFKITFRHSVSLRHLTLLIGQNRSQPVVATSLLT